MIPAHRDAPPLQAAGRAQRRPGSSICGLCLWASLALSGCATNRAEHIPSYHWTDAQSALLVMDQRAQSVKTLSAQCLIILTRPIGESVRLDGALVMAPPQKSVHLRAWKFNQPVFDLTLIPQGLWIETPRDESRRQQVLPASLSAAQVARAMSLFGGELLEGRELRVIDTGGPRFEVRKPIGNGQIVSAQIDRATLTVRQYQLRDAAGKVRFSLSLERYQDFGGIVWPTLLLATSENGKIELELRELELNAPLPDHAFDPPPRAEKVE